MNSSPYRPFALLAELTYRCPLHCPYCSNPQQLSSPGPELAADEWDRVIHEAAALGVLQVGFSGGEPLARPDLPRIIQSARAAGLYTNLLTSGLGLTAPRVAELRTAGLDALQLSFQSDEPALADEIAGTRSHAAKLAAAQLVQDSDLALGLNVVLHRRNIERLPEIIALAERLGATRLELANVQFYGWAFANRAALLPTREQALAAREIALAAQARLAGRLDLFYVLPDYYETRPKPCLQGWGRRYITVTPQGDALPCPTAGALLRDQRENVRTASLAWIWHESESFNRFRGTAWMPEPCQSCAFKEVDFGGCRCQAFALTGDAGNTDPACTLSPRHAEIFKLAETESTEGRDRFIYRNFKGGTLEPDADHVDGR